MFAVMVPLSALALCWSVFFFQAEDGIRDLVRSRGLGDVYKRQLHTSLARVSPEPDGHGLSRDFTGSTGQVETSLLNLSLIHI